MAVVFRQFWRWFEPVAAAALDEFRAAPNRKLVAGDRSDPFLCLSVLLSGGLCGELYGRLTCFPFLRVAIDRDAAKRLQAQAVLSSARERAAAWAVDHQDDDDFDAPLPADAEPSVADVVKRVVLPATRGGGAVQVLPPSRPLIESVLSRDSIPECDSHSLISRRLTSCLIPSHLIPRRCGVSAHGP